MTSTFAGESSLIVRGRRRRARRDGGKLPSSHVLNDQSREKMERALSVRRGLAAMPERKNGKGKYV